MENKILIVTALSLEFDAIRIHLKDTQLKDHPGTGSKYLTGKYFFEKKSFNVLLVESGAGNIRAADETSRAISYFNPGYTFFSGIADGIKDVILGDVVIASKIIGYEVGKEKEEFMPRYDSITVSYELEQIGKQLKRESTDGFSILVGPIASGEKVVASTKSVTYSYLKKYCSDALAVDMENGRSGCFE
ncbi:MAG: hypothetical protein WDO19_03870 [Bacteroidota bacterium]